MKIKIILFALYICISSWTFAQEKEKYDTIVFYNAEIINQQLLSIIDSFLVFEEENVTYYSDSMSLIIRFGYAQGNNKVVGFEINSFPIEYFIETDEYAYYKYKSHIIYLTKNIDNPLNECLFIKSNKHKKILKHSEDKEKTERLKYMEENKDYILAEDEDTEFEKKLQMHTSWFYIYKNGKFSEYLKVCPCCSYSSDCNKKR